MSTSSNGPTLTDAVGMGGVIAQEGFDYQLWDGLIRLPAWLKNPAFEALIFEGLEDLEARFLAPQATHGRLLERYQAKSGGLTPQDVRDIFEHFLEFERAHPRVTRLHTLVTRALPQSLRWVARDAERVRRARPFYAPFASVAASSDAKVRADFVDAFGDKLGAFVVDGVEVVERPLPNREAAFQGFAAAFAGAFPSLDLPPSRMSGAFDALCAVARGSIGVPLSRETLLDLIEEKIGGSVVTRHVFPLHVRSNRNEQNEGALEIDASNFSGVDSAYPGTEAWATGLITPLATTARWLKSRSTSRVSITGSYRLTTAFLLGWSFRAAVGFELEIPTRDGAWASDDRPDVNSASHPWTVSEPQTLHNDSLVASVGILRHPEQTLIANGLTASEILCVSLEQPVASAKMAQAAAANIKNVLSSAAVRLRARRVDLYYAGPAAVAVALGHRWNAMPSTQLHEFVAAERRYVPTALIP